MSHPRTVLLAFTPLMLAALVAACATPVPSQPPAAQPAVQQAPVEQPVQSPTAVRESVVQPAPQLPATQPPAQQPPPQPPATQAPAQQPAAQPVPTQAAATQPAAKTAAPAAPAAASDASAKQTGNYKVLAWNDLGMHCYNNDFSVLGVLPPYNTLWAQVIQMGREPRIVTKGIKVSYFFADNTHSSDKTNFWRYAKQLFGVDLKPDVGLTGKGLKGDMDLNVDHFEAVGIPLTEFSDSNPTVPAPFQLATVVVADANSGQELTRTQVVVPVSTEMRCDNCHKKDGIASTKDPINPVDNVYLNILRLHDYKHAKAYPAGQTSALESRQPVLCAECHSSNALAAKGAAGVASLSNAMHKGHSAVSEITPDTNGCYNCHPGPTTRCLRDVMSVKKNFTCQKCHGDLAKVAQNPNPWLNEPRCDAQGCHAGKTQQTQALYRQSKGHQGIYCEGCHDSTHAIAQSREANDGVKFMGLQGNASTLDTCEVCHGTRPRESFPHNFGEGD